MLKLNFGLSLNNLLTAHILTYFPVNEFIKSVLKAIRLFYQDLAHFPDVSVLH